MSSAPCFFIFVDHIWYQNIQLCIFLCNDSHSIDFSWGWQICPSNKFLGNADAVAPGAPLWESFLDCTGSKEEVLVTKLSSVPGTYKVDSWYIFVRWNMNKGLHTGCKHFVCIGVCVCVCVHAQLCQILCNPMDCSLPVSLSMEFSRQEYWSGLPFPTPGDLPDPRIEPVSPVSLALQADS